MMRLGDVIEELVEERGLDRSVLGEVICEGMIAAYSKRYPDVTFKAHYERKSDELIIEVEKEVVPTVEDEDTQIGLKKAKIINPSAEIGSRIVMPFDGKIGRIEILRAKQIIAQRIRKIESDAVYEQFKDKESTIVHGLIHKCERNGVVVKLQDHLAFLPKSLCIPTDKCIVGYPIRALLKEVLQEPRNDNQLILDRVSDAFLLRLFELEIPEIYDHIVKVKKIVRIAGYKSKIAVTSNDENVDAVGTCVGIKGARIQPILKELGGEKIDVIHWSDHNETLIKDALKPAVVNRVELIDQDNAQVWLDDDQRSLAIGKMGQNINLASQLAGISIHLVTSESSSSTENSSLT